MKLQVVLIAFLQAIPVESLLEVSGYIGDNVSLPSGADPSWKLSKVEWSIFSNTTWIATFHRGKEITEHFYQYSGRLHLNSTSGDLTIHNLNINDAMEYRVSLISTEGDDHVTKIRLIARQRLQKPTVQTVVSWPVNGGCLVMLFCSSSNEGVDFSWEVKPPGASVLNSSDHGGGAVALAWIPSNPQAHMELTCTSSRNLDKASSVTTLECDDDVPPPVSPPQSLPQPLPQVTNRYALLFMGGVLGGLLAVILLYLIRVKIFRKPTPEIKGKVFLFWQKCHKTFLKIDHVSLYF
ncbi:CD48 antigen isoform X2 [Antennarius striatus]